MRLLLDTHVFVWAVIGHSRMTAATRKLISNAEAVYVSAASIWEIAIKSQLGRIDADPDALVASIEDSGLIELPITAEHAAAVAKLPMHHADPFDRLLLAQSFTVPLRFVTADRALGAYGPTIEIVA